VSGGREDVLVARRVLAVLAALDQPAVLELAQPQGEGLARRTGVDLDVLEPGDTKAQLAEHEQAPAFPDDVQRVRDGADPRPRGRGGFGFLTHAA
jgi:hypothetical protein